MLSQLRSLVRGVRRRTAFERELDEELRFHLESRTDDLVRGGLTRVEAARRARLEFGNPEAYQDRCREARRLHLLDDLQSDLRFTWRSTRRQPLLAIAVVITLTLGIGITSGVFGYVNATMLQPRVETDRPSFVRALATYSLGPTRPGRAGGVTLEDYLALRESSRTLHEATAWLETFGPLGQDDPAQVRVLLVACNFFGVYRLERALTGRLLVPADCEAANPVIVISEALWRTRFAGDPTMVGRTIEFNGQPITVVGIVRSPFAGQINWSQAWLPYTLQSSLRLGPDLTRMVDGHLPHVLMTLDGRLNPGYSRADAAAELAVLAARQDRLHAGRSTSIAVTNGSDVQHPESRSFMVAVVSVLVGLLVVAVMMACANVATLLLGRADARQQEIAVRLSLGAGRLRLVRMLLTETLVLAVAAGLASLYLALRLPALLGAWLVNRPLEYPLTPDWRVFTYLAAVTLIAGVLAGLAPALESVKVSLVESLKGSRHLFGRPSGSRVRSLLIGAEVALGLVLLASAGLLARVHQRLLNTELGYETSRVLMPAVVLRGARPAGWSWAAYHRTLTERLDAIAGLEAVAYVRRLPLNGNTWGEFMGDRRAPRPILQPTTGTAARAALVNEVSPGFFDALGIQILRGRGLRDGDPPCGRVACPVVVSQALVRALLPSADPIGKTLRGPEGELYDIVGVARDTASESPWATDGPLVYQPWSPSARPYSLVVRFGGDAGATIGLVSRSLRDAFPGAIVEVMTIQSQIDRFVRGFVRTEAIVLILGGVALALAVIGIYGVVSFSVSRRTREMGIRMALGARTTDIWKTVIGSTARPVVAGLVVGLLVATAAGALGGLLVDRAPKTIPIDPRDPVAYAVVSLILAAAALGAMIGPARRAAGGAPVDALREQ
jgi:predicted permease